VLAGSSSRGERSLRASVIALASRSAPRRTVSNSYVNASTAAVSSAAVGAGAAAIGAEPTAGTAATGIAGAGAADAGASRARIPASSATSASLCDSRTPARNSSTIARSFAVSAGS
jgi:hypothetical protein